jgi:CheY-like chemotaxis protein
MSRPLLLLVDDAPEMHLIVRGLARRAGCDMASRGDVPGAREFLRETRPTLVLLDVRLPGASGVELCRWLQTDPERSTIPVALFTNWGFPTDVAAGIEAGADFVFAKDLVCDPAAWTERLSEILAFLPRRAQAYSQTESGRVHYSLLPTDWPETLERVFRHPTLRRMGLAVARAMVGRALLHVMDPPGLASNAVAGLLSDEWTVQPDFARRVCPPERVNAFVAQLSERIGFALGNAASAPVREALRQAFPDFPEFADG